jgi:hypothetical protein
VGDKSFDSGSVNGMKLNFAIEKSLHSLGLAPAQVAFRASGAHDFTTAGNMEATFSAFMGF